MTCRVPQVPNMTFGGAVAPEGDRKVMVTAPEDPESWHVQVRSVALTCRFSPFQSQGPRPAGTGASNHCLCSCSLQAPVTLSAAALRPGFASSHLMRGGCSRHRCLFPF